MYGSLGGGAKTGALDSQVCNLEAFVHKFQWVYVFICMHVLCGWCVSDVYKVKAHLLIALIRCLQGAGSYYNCDIHWVDRKLPACEHNIVSAFNHFNYMFISKLLGDLCTQIPLWGNLTVKNVEIWKSFMRLKNLTGIISIFPCGLIRGNSGIQYQFEIQQQWQQT